MSSTYVPFVDYQISSSSGSFTTTSTSYVDVTNLSVTITTSGRPVMIGMTMDGSTSPTSSLRAYNTSTGSIANGSIKFVRDSTDIGALSLVANGVNASVGCSSVGAMMIDHPAAGTYTYKLQGITVSPATLEVTHWKLFAYEIG